MHSIDIHKVVQKAVSELVAETCQDKQSPKVHVPAEKVAASADKKEKIKQPQHQSLKSSSSSGSSRKKQKDFKKAVTNPVANP